MSLQELRNHAQPGSISFSAINYLWLVFIRHAEHIMHSQAPSSCFNVSSLEGSVTTSKGCFFFGYGVSCVFNRCLVGVYRISPLPVMSLPCTEIERIMSGGDVTSNSTPPTPVSSTGLHSLGPSFLPQAAAGIGRCVH